MKTLKYLLLMMLMFMASSMKAWDLELVGKVGNYPIVMQMNVTNNGNGCIYGRYAFVSTLKKHGAGKKSSWLYFEADNRYLNTYSVYDSNNKLVEKWEDVRWDEYKNTFSFYGKVITAAKRTYRLDVSCSVMYMSEKAQMFLL